jgi:hypothetical protein
MTSTKYFVQIDGVQTDKTFWKKSAATDAAQTALTAKQGFKVEVVTQTGTVVFTAARRKVTKFTSPYTKTVDIGLYASLVPAGYVAAYQRLRNGAIVLRRETDEPEDPSRYAVLNTISCLIEGYAPTTRDAGQIMKAIGKAKAKATA